MQFILGGIFRNKGRGYRVRYKTLIVGCIFAIALNVYQFRMIEADTRHNYKAFYVYNTGNLPEIAIAHDISSRRYVAPFYYLGRLFPGSNIVMPKDGVSSWFSFDISLVSYGKANNLIYDDYDSKQLWPKSDVSDYIVDNILYVPNIGPVIKITKERFDFYVLDEQVDSFYILTPEGPPGRTKKIVFMDERLLEKEEKNEY